MENFYLPVLGEIVIQPNYGRVRASAEAFQIGGAYETDERHSFQPFRLRHFS